jgi:hypothetical protein
MKFCTACGAPVRGYGQFCGECGARINPQPPASSNPEVVNTELVVISSSPIVTGTTLPLPPTGQRNDEFDPQDHFWDGNTWWTLDRTYFWDGNAWRGVGWAPPNPRAVLEVDGPQFASTDRRAPPNPHVTRSSAQSTPPSTVWHRNGNGALVMALLPLASYLFVLLGAPLPPASGWIAIAGGIIGWRARGTVTAVQGGWAIVIAVATVILVIGSSLVASSTP